MRRRKAMKSGRCFGVWGAIMTQDQFTSSSNLSEPSWPPSGPLQGGGLPTVLDDRPFPSNAPGEPTFVAPPAKAPRVRARSAFGPPRSAHPPRQRRPCGNTVWSPPSPAGALSRQCPPLRSVVHACCCCCSSSSPHFPVRGCGSGHDLQAPPVSVVRRRRRRSG